MTLALAAEPHPMLAVIRATADVIEVDEDAGFCASIWVERGHVAVARLARSLRGTPHEGEALRYTMECSAGIHGHGLHLVCLSPDGILVR